MGENPITRGSVRRRCPRRSTLLPRILTHTPTHTHTPSYTNFCPAVWWLHDTVLFYLVSLSHTLTHTHTHTQMYPLSLPYFVTEMNKAISLSNYYPFTLYLSIALSLSLWQRNSVFTHIYIYIYMYIHFTYHHLFKLHGVTPSPLPVYLLFPLCIVLLACHHPSVSYCPPSF